MKKNEGVIATVGNAVGNAAGRILGKKITKAADTAVNKAAVGVAKRAVGIRPRPRTAIECLIASLNWEAGVMERSAPQTQLGWKQVVGTAPGLHWKDAKLACLEDPNLAWDEWEGEEHFSVWVSPVVYARLPEHGYFRYETSSGDEIALMKGGYAD